MADHQENDWARGSPHVPRASYRALDDAALVDAMRVGDERAIEEFLTRFHRVVYDRVRASRLRVPDLDDVIGDVLKDVAVKIVNGSVRPTRSIAAYLMTALRRRIALAAIANADRSGAEERAAVDLPGGRERAVPSVVSESTWRATYGPDWVPLPVPHAVERLASMIEEGLSKEERFILEALSNFVAQRDICQWLGITYAAGTQRIWRLRERLRHSAMRYADHFDRQERQQLDNFFLRFLDPTETGGTRRGTPRGGQG